MTQNHRRKNGLSTFQPLFNPLNVCTVVPWAAVVWDLLGVLQLVLCREASSLHQVVADAAWLDGVDQVHHRQAGADLLVLAAERTLFKNRARPIKDFEGRYRYKYLVI